MAAHLLEAERLSKSYGDNVVFEDVSFTLDAGQSISITSPSGSGKSTVLAAVGQLLGVDGGRVLVEGQDVSGLDDEGKAALRRKTFGFVFQHAQLVGSLRAYENVAVPARFAPEVGFDVDERARGLLCELGLEDRLDHFPYQLSVGQKRRVALARALLLDPKVILADEPTNDLDADSADSVTAKLFEQVEAGRALVLVTHDLDLAARADRRYRLRGGRLVEEG